MNKKERLERDMLILEKRVLDIMPVMSIVLHGGYGRDEGSWICEDGECRPYNDYDLILVTEEKLPAEQIMPLRKRMASEVGIRWVDIAQYTPRELRTLRPTIKHYDLKYASKVIYGNAQVLDWIPVMEPSCLSLQEGQMLFFTRLWTLLGCLDERGLSCSQSGEKVRFFRNQMAKAVLAVVDVLLLQRQSYHLSYRRRVQRLAEYFPERSELEQIAQWALDEKLVPKAPAMSAVDIQMLYNQVSNLFFSEMLKNLSLLYRRPIHTVMDIERYLLYAPLCLLKRIGSVMLKRTFERERHLKTKLAQAYIAGAYQHGAIEQKELLRGVQLVQRLDRDIPMDLSWDRARVLVAQMRMA